MTIADITPEQLASALAARLMHDALGPASGIASAFELMADPSAAALRDEALTMASDSAKTLLNMLVLFRSVYGGGSAMTSAELTKAGQALFEGSRARLDLRIDGPPPTVASTRIFLGLLHIVAGVATGGLVSATHAGDASNTTLMVVDATAARTRMPEEVYRGLAGETAGAGIPHRWSAAYLIGALARSSGGSIEVGDPAKGVAFRASIRAEIA